MKKISILALIVFVVLICINLINAGKGFSEGWNKAGDSTDHTCALVSLRVTKTDAALATDSLYNDAFKKHVPYHIETIETLAQESTWAILVKFLIFPVALFALYGFYCLIRLLISVSRKEVFIRNNVRRMRIFVYGSILVSICVELHLYLLYMCAVAQIQLPGYEIHSYSMKTPWLFVVLLALLTEIFAAGVRIKEEQDLTV